MILLLIVLVARFNNFFQQDIDADLKIAAANCLRRLAFTFQEAQRQNYPALRNQLAKLERLLFDNMERVWLYSLPPFGRSVLQ